MMWELPGPRRFLREVVESISHQRHVIIRAPKWVLEQDMIMPLQDLIDERGLGTITPVWCQSNQTAAETLRVCLATNVNDESDLLNEETPPSRILAIHDLQPGTEDGWRRLLKLAGRHAQTVNEPPYLLLILANSSFEPVPEDLRLAQHPWWGVLASADIDQTMEAVLREMPRTHIADYYWKRALCRGLAGSDLVLARTLTEEMPRTLDEVCLCLATHREVSDVPQFHEFSEIHSEQAGFLSTQPPACPSTPAGMAMWTSGWLDWRPLRGVQVSSTVYARLGVRDEIERRLWQGQLEVILPLVEDVRHLVITRIKRVCGPNWSRVLVQSTAGLDQERVETEIGPLGHYLRKAKNEWPALQPMIEVATSWADIRNSLAHFDWVGHDVLTRGVRIVIGM